MSRYEQFWNKEYKSASHLRMSSEPSSDLMDFCVWLKKYAGDDVFHYLDVLDIGCGNGRNSIYLASVERIRRGYGFDISQSAIDEAVITSGRLPLSYMKRTVQEDFPVEDGAVGLVIDLMVSHVVRERDRAKFLSEIVRVLEDGGWYLIKTFMRDEDANAMEMIRNHGSKTHEANAYIHPKFKGYEHVWSEDELVEFLEPHFRIHHIVRSHGHKRSGKRRSMIMYCQKKPQE